MSIFIAIILLLILIFVILIYICCCKNREPGRPPEIRSPSVQVVNNSGTLIHKVKVGGVEFTENLDMCAEGCSTGFIDVAQGTNNIQLQQTDGGSWTDLGDLGPFENGINYAVNIKTSGTFCAELWKRLQSDSTFNDDTTRVLIASNCP